MEKTRFPTPAQQLWNQYQPCDAQWCATACNSGVNPQLGDRLTVVGEAKAIENVEKYWETLPVH